MKYIIRFTMLACVALALASCDSDWNAEEMLKEEGTVNLTSLAIDIDSRVEVVSRADDAAAPVTDDYRVKIVDAATGDIAGEWRYADMPDKIRLHVGKYLLDVENTSLQNAAFDAPWLHASREFTVAKDETTDLGAVTCTVSNVLVSVKYSEALAAALGEDVKVEIMTMETAPLLFTPTETRIGYLAMPENGSTLIATFEGTVNGRVTKLRKSFGGVAVGQHHVITFSLNTGSINPSILVDANLTFDDVDIDIPGAEEPLVGPAVTSETLNLDGVNVITDDIVARLLITAPEGVAHINVTIISNDLTPEILAEVGLADKFDLADPGEIGEALSELGFPVGDEVLNQREVVFDITEFMPILGAFKGEHDFILEVIDNKGQTTSVTLRLFAQ